MKTGRFASLVALALVVVAVLLLWPEERARRAPSAGAASRADDAPYDLDRDEERGGHTLGRHVGRTDAELRQRLAAEPGISAASSFTDRATAERVVAATLEREQDRIDRWRARRGGNLALDYRGAPGEVVGRTLPRGARDPRPTSDARVVLAPSGASFRVVTAYPLESR